MTRALVLFSGGQDSATCLALALSQYDRVDTVGFHYGQRHAVELTARVEVRDSLAGAFPEWRHKLGDDHMLDLGDFGKIGESALTTDRAIEMTERGLPSSFVPGRNLVFLTFAAALADRLGCDTIITGVCETDFSGYPDCRQETITALQAALNLGMEGDFEIVTPLMAITKAQTWALAKRVGGEILVDIIRSETHTCYNGDHIHFHPWGYGCGECPACEIRAAGWNEWVADGRPA